MNLNVRFVFGADETYAVSEDGTIFPIAPDDALNFLHGRSDLDLDVPNSNKPGSGSPASDLVTRE